MTHIARDLRQAVRTIRRSPASSAVIVVLVGLAIGANTTVFAWMDGIVRRPFPAIADGSQLLALNVADANGHVEGMPPVAYPVLQEWRSRTEAFTGIAAHVPVRLNFRTTGQDRGEPLWTELVSTNFCDVVRVGLMVGRCFSPSDEAEGLHVVVISHAAWQRRFGGSNDILGRTVLLNGVPATVIGVTARDFHGVISGLAFEMWVPLWLQPPLLPGTDWMRDRTARRLQAIARLRDGVAIADARQQLHAAAAAISRSHGDVATSGGAVRWVTDTQLGSLMGPLGAAMLGITLVVLIAACANVAGLLLARNAAAVSETAIHVALGASRRTLIQQSLTSAVLLALLGCLLGIGVAVLAKDSLIRFVPRVALPVNLDIELSPRVIAFAVGVAVLSAIAFGMTSAIRGSRLHILDALKSRPAPPRPSALRRALVMTQVALSLTSLAIALLLVRSLAATTRIPLGYDDPSKVLLMSLDLSFTRLRGDALMTLLDQAMERVRGQAGISRAAFANFVPLSFGPPPSLATEIERYVAARDETMHVAQATISDGYFATVGIPMVSGRSVSADDRSESPRVAVVNEAFVRRYWSTTDPIGRRLNQGDGWATVVGVARDSAIDSVSGEVRPLVYRPWRQVSGSAVTMYLRVDGADPLVLVETIRSTLASVHPELSPLDPGTFASHMQAAFFVQSVGSSMLSIFGAIAALITAAGVGGLAAQNVAERRKEMAIAIALGAGPRAVAWTIFAPMLKLTGLGVMAGLIIARAAAGLIRSQLPGVNGMDGWVLASTTALVMVIAIASCAGPLWRAIHTDPISTMRT